MQFTLLLIASLSYQSVPVPAFFFFFFFFFANYRRAKEKVRITKYHLPSSVGMYARWTPPLVTERAARGCYVAEVHHFHLPVCQMSCLAELHTVMVLTKWQEGGHTPVNVNLAAMHRFPKSAEAPTHQKTEKGVNCSLRKKKKKASPKELDICIKHTRSRACITAYTTQSPLIYKHNMRTLRLKLHLGSCN